MGTTSSFFGGGGGDPLPQPEWLFQKSSYTYTFPYDGTVIVHVVGAGGSGAVQQSSFLCTGGGAGGYSRKQFSVTTSTSATVTSGVGGKSVGNDLTVSAGVAGTVSTFVLGSDTLTANGGAGGNQYPGPNVSAAGGTASGGDVNYQGGRSGKIYAQYNNAFRACTGGGAVNLFGLSTDDVAGGDLTNASTLVGTGGGGTGGKGGDIGCSGPRRASGGGGAAGPAKTIESGPSGDARSSAGGPGGARLFKFNGPLLDGVGGRGLFSFINSTSGLSPMPSFGTFGMGAGTGGYVALNGEDGYGADVQPPTAGLFGGGGGSAIKGNGGFGSHASLGGGGGAITTESGSSAAQMRRMSGAGGDGVIIIEYIGRG
tara:strand:+ start:16 stop:1125 length:1110 start_codon:yes stop_codon:yes gene_type:complete